MNKKTYKQMQNRLLRAEKARIIAEQKLQSMLRKPIQYGIRRMNTVEYRAAFIINRNDLEAVDLERIQKSIAYSIADKLFSDKAIIFEIDHRAYDPYVEKIIGRLNVVTPFTEDDF